MTEKELLEIKKDCLDTLDSKQLSESRATTRSIVIGFARQIIKLSTECLHLREVWKLNKGVNKMEVCYERL